LTGQNIFNGGENIGSFDEFPQSDAFSPLLGNQGRVINAEELGILAPHEYILVQKTYACFLTQGVRPSFRTEFIHTFIHHSCHPHATARAQRDDTPISLLRQTQTRGPKGLSSHMDSHNYHRACSRAPFSLPPARAARQTSLEVGARAQVNLDL
jgi:hypothetical protein